MKHLSCFDSLILKASLKLLTPALTEILLQEDQLHHSHCQSKATKISLRSALKIYPTLSGGP